MPNRLPVIAFAAFLSACSSSSSQEERAKFAEPIVSTIAEARLPGVSDGLTQLLMLDVDGDARPDALAAFYQGTTGKSNYAVYLSNGDGTFRAGTRIERFFGARAADVDRDGRADLVGCSQHSDGVHAVGVRLASAAGLGPMLETAMPWSCVHVATGDFDGDGKTDVVAVVAGREWLGYLRFVILKGRGDGTFEVGPLQSLEGIREDSGGDVLPYPAHFNADGREDLAIAFHWGNQPQRLRILLSKGDGTFSLAWPTGAEPPEFTGRAVTGLQVRDFDNDGRTDVFVSLRAHVIPLPPNPNPFPGPSAPPAPPVQFVLRGLGDGTLAGPVAPRDDNISDATVADIDSDGKLDLLFWQPDVQPGVFALQAAFGLGDGSFLSAEPILSSSGSGFLQVLDVNGDGRLDVVSLGGTGALAVFPGESERRSP